MKEYIEISPIWFAKYQNLFFTKYTPQGYYLVSSCGDIVNSRTQNVLKASRDRKGKGGSGQTYPYVKLRCTDGKIHRFKVHRLVAAAFCPNSYNKRIVHHIDCEDRERSNNCADNLLWVRQSEHDELKKLWQEDRRAYYQRVSEIQAENAEVRKD